MVEDERILILAKTYPSPSAQHSETSCVAGITETGLMRRLYPVPFRLIADESQFRKWEWIRAKLTTPTHDPRAESRRVYVDTIKRDEYVGTSAREWQLRRELLSRVPAFADPEELEAERRARGVTLGLVRPAEVVELDIEPVESEDWTEEEKRKLVQLQNQGGLFGSDADVEERKSVPRLKKVPFNFYYRCAYGNKEVRTRITDWEVGVLYWHCRSSHGANWIVPMRQRLIDWMRKRDLCFLLGNVHQHQHRWLIVSLLYPPKAAQSKDQLTLGI